MEGNPSSIIWCSPWLIPPLCWRTTKRQPQDITGPLITVYWNWSLPLHMVALNQNMGIWRIHNLYCFGFTSLRTKCEEGILLEHKHLLQTTFGQHVGIILENCYIWELLYNALIIGYLCIISLSHHMWMNILCVGHLTRKLVKHIFRNASVMKKYTHLVSLGSTNKIQHVESKLNQIN